MPRSSLHHWVKLVWNFFLCVTWREHELPKFNPFFFLYFPIVVLVNLLKQVIRVQLWEIRRPEGYCLLHLQCRRVVWVDHPEEFVDFLHQSTWDLWTLVLILTVGLFALFPIFLELKRKNELLIINYTYNYSLFNKTKRRRRQVFADSPIIRKSVIYGSTFFLYMIWSFILPAIKC